MNKGLEALKEYRSQQQGVNVYADKYLDIIEKELKDQRKRLTIISEILVDISKGNYSDLKVAIKEIREVLE